MSLSEIRVNTTKTRTGVGTITYTETGPVITGIATASNFKTGSTNVHSTGVELSNINTGGSTATFGGAISGTTASFSGTVSIGGTLTYEDVTNIDSVGVITARNGIYLDRFIYHSGDLNTSFGFPNDATDTFVVNTSSTEKFRIDSSGNIGQGTDTPTTPDGSNADNPLNGTPIFTMYGDSPAINLVSSTTTSSDWSSINFGRTGSSSNPYRAIIGYKQSDDILRINAKNSITFDTGGDINSGEALRIDSAGSVRIGNTTQNQYTAADDLIVGTGSGDRGLTLYSGSADAGVIAFSDGTSDTAYRSGQIIYNHSANSMDFRTNGNYIRLTIDSDGDFGFGTTNTDGHADHTNLFIGGMANLYAETSASSSNSTSWSNNGYIASSGGWKYRSGGKTSNIYQYDGKIGFRTAGTGSAGGTISWKERFTIGDDQNIYIWGNETGNNRAIFYNGPGYFGTYASSSNSVARQLRWHTAGGSASEKMRLSSDGFLLLNCQDTGFSSGYTDMTIGNTSASNTGLTIASSPTNGYSRLHFADGTSGGAKYAGFIAYAHGTDELLFGTGNSGSTKFCLNSDGAVQFGNGSVSGGNYSSSGAINLIDFGSGTTNRGMGWGGTTANYANIWTEYGSGALHFGMGIRPTGTSSGWVSSYGSGSIGRSALKMDLNGDIRIFTGSSSTIAAGSATNLTEKLLIHRTGQITHQFAGRYGQVIGSTDGSGAYILLDGEAGNPLASGSDYMYMEHTSTGQFEMWNGKSGVTSSKFLDVAPAGYVNTPRQPSFAVYRNQSGWTVATGTEMVFNSARHNIGGHYSTSNGRFTAPISGSYFFSFFSIHNSNVNSGYVRLFKNGARIYGGDLHFTYDQSGHWDNVAFSQVLYLSANDYVSIYNGNPAVNYHGNHWQCFSGYLLG